MLRSRQQEVAALGPFEVNGESINRVHQFKYLGRILDDTDGDEHAACQQLAKARDRWGRVGRVLKSQGADPKTMGHFYQAIVQAVLLYGSESWTLSETMMRKLRSFHSRAARYICNRHIRPRADGSWEYPSTEVVLRDAGLFSIDEYIRRRRNTIWDYAYHRPIFRECRNTRFVHSNKVVWWKLN